ncbi:molybdenum cofactor guanylyltransferase [Caulobacter sp. S45]|uniref:molybdenum cofactor guanylyltransferase n=1 Tax=Caulobacter sp. S45 TaxID=1641861 RepID=UPI001577212B|nr:molybdenum cofactor guanylyltransferase [Caulobacter sp. S45]
MIGGLILAGGRSSRFGREKALAELEGEPLIARVERVLARGASPLAVSARGGSAAAAYAAKSGLACLPDDVGDVDGPLAGVKVGLRWAALQGLKWLVTSPCDTPFLPRNLVERLCEGRAGCGAVARTPTAVQPLCALWPVAALGMIETTSNHPPIRALLERVGVEEVVFENPDAFANLNTPEDYARALARAV